MAQIASAASLLHAALQDIHAGKIDQVHRLPALAERCTDSLLRELMRSEADRAAAQAGRFRDAGIDVAGPRNLWMAGVLDDAERDTAATQPGRLLDVALIGAIRKGKAAEIVAAETALALARQIDAAGFASLAADGRGEDIATDRRFRARLDALTAS